MTTDSGRIRLDMVHLLTSQQQMIQGYAYAITRDHHLAEDTYQEVAAIVAAAWSAVPGGEEALPWLREVTRRKALELGRRKRRMPALSEEILSAMAECFTDGDQDDERDLRRAMAACVDKLPPEARTVIDGRYRDDLSCEEIAERAGRSVQGVYALLKRLRVSLSRCVQQAVGQPLRPGEAP